MKALHGMVDGDVVDLKKKAVAEGRIQGRAEGRIQGRAEGRIQGRAEGRVEIFGNLRSLIVRRTRSRLGTRAAEETGAAIAGVTEMETLLAVYELTGACASRHELLDRLATL